MDESKLPIIKSPEQKQRELESLVNNLLLRTRESDDKSPIPKLEMHIMRLEDIDFENLYLNSSDWTGDPNPPPQSILHAGSFVMNPDTIEIDWNTVRPERIKLLQFPGFFREAGRSNDTDREGGHKFIEYVLKTEEAKKYLFPGFEYLKYLIENPDKIPPSIRNVGGNTHIYMSSILQTGKSMVRSPSAMCTTKGLNYFTKPLLQDWQRDDYIVAVER